MTVSELMAALTELPPDREVEMWVECGFVVESVNQVRSVGTRIILAAEGS